MREKTCVSASASGILSRMQKLRRMAESLAIIAGVIVWVIRGER